MDFFLSPRIVHRRQKEKKILLSKFNANFKGQLHPGLGQFQIKGLLGWGRGKIPGSEIHVFGCNSGEFGPRGWGHRWGPRPLALRAPVACPSATMRSPPIPLPLPPASLFRLLPLAAVGRCIAAHSTDPVAATHHTPDLRSADLPPS